jgi:magnesium-transporting ATPase (P-type)
MPPTHVTGRLMLPLNAPKGPQVADSIHCCKRSPVPSLKSHRREPECHNDISSTQLRHQKNVANLALVLTNRSQTRTILSTLRTSNPMLWWIVGGALALLALVLYVPFLRELFGFALLHLNDLLICLAAGFACILWFESLKVIHKHRLPP